MPGKPLATAAATAAAVRALEQLSLFTDRDFETEPMVTIMVSIRRTCREPRATYRFPDGQHNMEDWSTVDPAQAAHYSVRLLDHGPYMLSVQSCQSGAHTHCRNGEHERCPFKPGGVHENGSVLGVEYLQRRDEEGFWRVAYDEHGRGIRLLPTHVWFCSCDCHTDLLTAGGK